MSGKLVPVIERAYPQLPPTFFASPLPPRVPYHHLSVPVEVAMVCHSPSGHKRNVTGKGVLVAMPDTGFFKHPFYSWHGYNYQATLSPDAIRVERDEYGHGTAEAAHIFANAPDIDFIGVKMGANPTLAFKTASDLFPAQMPEVIAVGGMDVHPGLNGEDFQMEASDYASSFDSQIYPGRHVPDVCGLVEMQPRAIYIMLPVEPSCTIDTGLAGGTYPHGDETAPDDGWSVISGTSAASPQVAGVCALLKQVQPGLSPALVKAILRASARDVKTGQSSHGQPAGEGHDGATGAGLVDAYAAYPLARSITPRDLQTVPPPR